MFRINLLSARQAKETESTDMLFNLCGERVAAILKIDAERKLVPANDVSYNKSNRLTNVWGNYPAHANATVYGTRCPSGGWYLPDFSKSIRYLTQQKINNLSIY